MCEACVEKLVAHAVVEGGALAVVAKMVPGLLQEVHGVAFAGRVEREGGEGEQAVELEAQGGAVADVGGAGGSLVAGHWTPIIRSYVDEQGCMCRLRQNNERRQRRERRRLDKQDEIPPVLSRSLAHFVIKFPIFLYLLFSREQRAATVRSGRLA